MLPEKLHFPVNGSFILSLGEAKKIRVNTNPTSYLSRLLFWQGIKGFEYHSIRIFIELAKKSSIFFDIGANIGYYSLVSKAFNKAIRVIGFEPMPAANKYFKMNVESNDFNNITVEDFALSNFQGDATFYAIKNPKFPEIADHLSGDGGLSSKQSGARSVESFKVKCITLDEYIKMKLKPDDKIDLIKLDTEASEHLVLQGAKNVLANHRPIILCEVLHDHIEAELESIFSVNDYAFYKAYPDGLRKVRSLMNNLDNVVDYFFVPLEKIVLIKNFEARNGKR